MALYSIKDTTLTAMGDVIRSKYGIDSIEPEVFTITFNNSMTNQRIELSTNYSKYKYRFEVKESNSYSGRYNIEFDKLITTIHGSSINSMSFGVYEGLVWTEYLPINGFNISYCDFNADDYTTLEITAIPIDENNKEYKYTPTEMIEKVDKLYQVPDSAFNITGSGSYKFSNDGWNWFIEQFGDKLNVNNINALNMMFYNSGKLRNIPFDIYITKDVTTLSYMFNLCKELENIPYIIGPEKAAPTNAYSGTITMDNLFNTCLELKEIPYDFFWKMVPNKTFWDKHKELSTSSMTNMFSSCYKLRELPDLTMLTGNHASYNCFYSNAFNYCYSLDKAINLPVQMGASLTSNGFSNTFSYCGRLSRVTFETNTDGTPKVAKWKSQTIDLSNYTGWTNQSTAGMESYGFPQDKNASSASKYQALKNDPDWYTTSFRTSRYNRTSAVETINSLPDCSATGTNTIKFKGLAGIDTDGGAIDTLTDAEIAVATAKGWTVTLA